MIDQLAKKIIIRDTEYTSWEGSHTNNWAGKDQFREIIQIGAILVDTNTFEEIDSFEIFIKPIKNPILSEYIKNLTKITQSQVDNAKNFIESVKIFEKWVGGYDVIDVYAYGRDDIIFAENCGLHQICFPFKKDRFKNIVDVFVGHNIPAKSYSSGTINQLFNIPNTAIEHNALGDARNIMHSLNALKQTINKKFNHNIFNK